MWLFDEVLHTKIKPAGGGKYKYTASGLSTTSIAARTRSKMDKEVEIIDEGLAGLLDKMGYKK